MQQPQLRPARKEDCAAIAALYRISSDGVADYIWTRLAQPGEDILDVGRRRYEQEESVFSYRSCTVVETNGAVTGMLVTFPMNVDSTDSESDPVLAPYSKLEEDNSYYICGMAVFPEYRGHGIGTRLLALAEEKARKLGIRKMSLVVFEQNIGACRLYRRKGYRETGRERIYPHPLIHYTGDALLMVKVMD